MVDFSLIISTRNRAARLEKCLAAIAQLRTHGRLGTRHCR